MTRYLYTARLVPIGGRVNIPKLDGTPWYTSFHNRSFDLERESRPLPPVCVGHDLEMVVGNMTDLYAYRGWWECNFALQPELPNEFEVGQPVSVGLDVLCDTTRVAMLREVSIVEDGNVKGAEVISRLELSPATKRAEPEAIQPIQPFPAPKPVAAAPRVLHRTPKPNRDANEAAELRRRQAWLEDNGYDVAFEDILDNLKHELGYGRDLGRKWRKHRTAA